MIFRVKLEYTTAVQNDIENDNDKEDDDNANVDNDNNRVYLG